METKHSDIKLDAQTFANVKQLVKNYLSTKDYKVTGNLENLDLLLSERLKLKTSLSKQKEFKKRIFFLSKGISIKKINNLLSEFDINSIKLELSDRERDIIKKRKEWVELRDKAQKALLDYKMIKGDYYKK